MTTSSPTLEELEPLITAIRQRDRNQLSRAEYRYLAELLVARGGCRLLVFGAGNDSELWLRANAAGTTIFLEDSESWIAKVEQRLPEITIHQVTYGTKRSQWQELLEGPVEHLELELPSAVEGTPWDIIFVDAPTAFFTTCPGRMKSIYTGARLARRGRAADVLVHDCDRPVEQAYCDRFFASGELVRAFHRIRHYRTDGSSDGVIPRRGER